MGIAADVAALPVLRVRAGRGCRAPPPGRYRTGARHFPPPGARDGRRHPGGEHARHRLDVHGHPAAQAGAQGGHRGGARRGPGRGSAACAARARPRHRAPGIAPFARGCGHPVRREHDRMRGRRWLSGAARAGEPFTRIDRRRSQRLRGGQRGCWPHARAAGARAGCRASSSWIRRRRRISPSSAMPASTPISCARSGRSRC